MRIRRYDVMAEFQKEKALKEGRSLEEAMGFGIWMAKVIASRKFGRKSFGNSNKTKSTSPKKGTIIDGKIWNTLNGIPQTDETFKKEIIERMGSDFYYKTFSPLVKKLMDEGLDYKPLRDKNSEITGWYK